ncbi:hypothetical protein BV20DRAFT_1053621 [Pilatotrama ljubarskyi]|nr:hypothetical protein BV20DRAFT_1053621 [Pilatotrama ljubarskyi]
MASFGLPKTPETPSPGSQEPLALSAQNEVPYGTGSTPQPPPFSNLPLCDSCISAIRTLLAHPPASQPVPSGSTEWTALAHFADYTIVPALVHRSQLFAISSAGHLLSSSAAPLQTAESEVQPASGGPSAAVQRNARGVKVACTHCRQAGKRCDEARPCMRCISSGLEGSCVNPSPKPRRRRVIIPTTRTRTASRVAGGVTGVIQLSGSDPAPPACRNEAVPRVFDGDQARGARHAGCDADAHTTSMCAFPEDLQGPIQRDGGVTTVHNRHDAILADSSWTPPWPPMTDDLNLPSWGAPGLTADDSLLSSDIIWSHHAAGSSSG